MNELNYIYNFISTVKLICSHFDRKPINVRNIILYKPKVHEVYVKYEPMALTLTFNYYTRDSLASADGLNQLNHKQTPKPYNYIARDSQTLASADGLNQLNHKQTPKPYI